MENLIGRATPELSPLCERQPNRRARRRAETRERIIHAALDLFCERGVNATTVEDITNAADVGKGTFFNYFPSKEHILADLCQLQMGKIKELVSEAIHSTVPVDKIVHELALVITEEFARCPALVQSVLVPSLSSESARQQMANDFAKDRKILGQLMAARQIRGEIREDLEPLELALHFQQALFGTTVLWSLDPSRSLSARLQDMADVFWSGIRSREATERRAEILEQRSSSQGGACT